MITVCTPMPRTEQVFWKCLWGDRVYFHVKTLLENLKSSSG